MIKQRIKDLDDKVVGYMVADEVSQYEDIVAIGISLCHKNDKFDKELGESIAYKRAEDFNKSYKIKEFRCSCGCNSKAYGDNSLNNQLNRFIVRCVQYYKDKSVIVPKVIFV